MRFMYNVIAALSGIFLSLNAFECDVFHINFFFKKEALTYSQPKGTRPTHQNIAMPDWQGLRPTLGVKGQKT